MMPWVKTIRPASRWKELMDAHREGSYLIMLRNRGIGRETLDVRTTSRKGLALSVHTQLQTGRLDIDQNVTAKFDDLMRPESARVEARINGRGLEMELQVQGDQVWIHSDFQDETHTETRPLSHEPLLLVDNCFSLHAVAGWLASRRSEGSALFTSIPSLRKVLASVQSHPPILLGGKDFGTPAVMLRHLPEPSEYFWLRRDWIERIALPLSHLWVEWVEPVDSTKESR